MKSLSLVIVLLSVSLSSLAGSLADSAYTELASYKLGDVANSRRLCAQILIERLIANPKFPRMNQLTLETISFEKTWFKAKYFNFDLTGRDGQDKYSGFAYVAPSFETINGQLYVKCEMLHTPEVFSSNIEIKDSAKNMIFDSRCAVRMVDGYNNDERSCPRN